MRKFTLHIAAFLLASSVLSCGGKNSSDDPVEKWLENKDSLMETASSMSVKNLIVQFESEDSLLRMSAYYTLVKVEPGEFLSVLYSRYEPGYEEFVHQRYRRIVSEWNESAVLPLAELLQNNRLIPRERTRTLYVKPSWGWFAMDCLYYLGDRAQSAVPALLRKIGERSVPVSLVEPENYAAFSQVFESIGIGSDEILSAVASELNRDSVPLQANACYALGSLASPGNEQVISRLRNLRTYLAENNDSDNRTREIALRCALYELGTDRNSGIEWITGYLRTRDRFISSQCYEAVKALIRMGDDECMAIAADYINRHRVYAINPVIAELDRQGPETEILELLAATLEYEDGIEFALDVLFRFGPDAVTVLPALQNKLTEYRELAREDDDYLPVCSTIEETIIRVSEGTGWQF